MRLALGTVQFGLPYGVANKGGRPLPAEIAAILDAAHGAGIDLLDTAPVYGDCEALLGQLAAASQFNVVTKTHSYNNSGRIDDPHDGVAATLSRSLAALRCDRVEAVLIHSVPDATGAHAGRIVDALHALKASGKVGKIGITVYEPADLDRFRHFDAIDLVQLPLSILDQRFRACGAMAALRRRGIAIHARSLFLQGALLMDPATLPAHLAPARPLLARLHAAFAAAGASPLAGALAFVGAQPEVDYALVGVQTAAQLREITAVAKANVPIEFAEFACDDPAIIDPRRWPEQHA